MQYIDSELERAWATEWIDTLLALNDVVSTPAQRKEIFRVLESMRESSSKTITEFCTLVQDEEIRQALFNYTSEGASGELFDADRDDFTFGSMGGVTCFEMEEIMGRGNRYCLPVLLYLFHCIERSLHGQLEVIHPSLIVIDEAWVMLAHPLMEVSPQRERIEKWLRELRKRNCAVILEHKILR